MNIEEMISNYRNDFYALFECPLCGYRFKAWGSSDAN